MFRALQCPSSGARQTAVAASGFRMNVEVEVFSAHQPTDHGWEHFHLHIHTETETATAVLRAPDDGPKHVEQCLYDKAINFNIDCCI